MNQYCSQNGEDFLLWNLFKKNSGFFIDVGAFDGKHLSNSYIFEKAGWKGICLEPHPYYFKKCEENRPDSICVNAACIGDENINQIPFQYEELGLLSGIQKMDKKDIEKRYHRRGLKFQGYKEVTVAATTLNKVLETYNINQPIDFISIDVEGFELGVLKGLDTNKYSPKVLVVESDLGKDESELDDYVISQLGYHKSRRLKENIFYCHNMNDAEILSCLDIKGVTTFSEHPLGKAYNLPPQRQRKIYNFLKNVKHKLKNKN